MCIRDRFTPHLRVGPHRDHPATAGHHRVGVRVGFEARAGVTVGAKAAHGSGVIENRFFHGIRDQLEDGRAGPMVDSD